MRLKNILFFTLASLAFTSCIQDEALNVEAAIDGCKGSNIQLASINHESKKVDLYVSWGTDLSQIDISFTLPAGAAIAADKPQEGDKTGSESEEEEEPQGPVYDFSKENPRYFTVTSEDKNHTTQYEIRVRQTELPTKYTFETLQDGTNSFDIFTERQDLDGEIRSMQWASGNQGFWMTGMAKSKADYPTSQNGEGIQGGKCVKLVTRTTGSFGLMTNPPMPIAAGNLFIGSFDLAYALKAPREATKFGFPFKEKPVSMSGYYKFKAGEKNTKWDSNKNEVTLDYPDKCDIYAVLYETDEQVTFLDGNTSLTSPQIVLMARLPQDQIRDTEKWTHFDLPFNPVEGGKTFSQQKLEEGKYKLAIVLSSSVRGAYFEGAVGSTLYVDELELHCE